MFWALDGTIEEDREPYVRLLAAFIEAVRYINDPANEDGVVGIATVTGHSDEVARASLQDFIELEFWPLDRDGLPQDKIESTIDEQVRLENIEEGNAPTHDDVADPSLWEEAMELVEQMNG